MAANRPIRRIITLIFDRKAGQRAAREMQQTIANALQAPIWTKSLTKIAGDITRLFAQAVVSVGGYIKVIGDLTERGGEFLNVQRAFSTAVGNTEGALGRFRTASRGLIADYDLMRESNFAFTLGAAKSVEGMEELISVSQDLGRALGIDPVKAMHDLSIGIGRNSKRILDNLGIIVDGAVTLESTMEAARKRIEQMGGSVGQGADKVKRFQTAWTNLKDQVGAFLSESNTVTLFFDSVAGMLDTLAAAVATQDTTIIKEVFSELGGMLGDVFMASFFAAVSGAMKSAPEWLIKLIGVAVGGGGGFIAGGALGGIPGAIGGTIAGGILGGAKMDDLVKEFTDLLDTATEKGFEAIDARFIALQAKGKELRSFLEANAPEPGPGTLGPAGLTSEELEAIKKAEEERLKLLLKLADLRKLEGEDFNELVRFYDDINRKLRTGNLSEAERVELLERQAELMEIIAPKVPMMDLRAGKGALSMATAAIRFPAAEQMTEMVSDDRFDPTGIQGFLADNFQELSTIFNATGAGMVSVWESAFATIGEKSAAFKELELLRAQKLAQATTEVERQRVEEWFAIESAHVRAMDGLWEKLAKGFAASVLMGLAEVASAKVAENVALALAAVGDGLMGNPAAFAAAAKYTAAAAAWAALGGAAGNAAQRLTSGGGGGGYAGGSAIGSGADRTERVVPIVIVNVDGLDPDNPAHVRLVQRAAMNGQEQWGDMKPTTQRYATRRRTG